MKSKLLFFVLAMTGILCATPFRTMAADALVLSNPGFEDQMAGWESQDDGGMSKVTEEAAHTGKFGLRVTDENDQAGSGISSSKMPITAGKTYEVQCWARNVAGTGVGIYLRFSGADGKVITQAKEEEKAADRAPAVEVDRNQTEWKLLSGKKVAPAGSVSVAIYVHSYSKHKVTADFDDFALLEVAK